MVRVSRSSGFNGGQFRKARREKRLSQTELAGILGVHRSTVVRWEVGMAEPSPQQVEEIAIALSTPKNWFFYEAAEAISLDSPAWLLDPALKAYPLEELQQQTSTAMLSLNKTAGEIARSTRLGRQRVEDLLVGKLPTAREIQRFRDVYGRDFDPTPERAEAGTRWTTPVGGGPLFTTDEKIDIVLQRLSRLEDHFVALEQRLDKRLSGVLPALEASLRNTHQAVLDVVEGATKRR